VSRDAPGPQDGITVAAADRALGVAPAAGPDPGDRAGAGAANSP
jgi:hypothetical protein